MKPIDCVIIPARGGSKRIKHKNMQPFCGTPMLERSIETAKMVSECVIVSSDDLKILEFSKLKGAYPLLRDEVLADDITPTLPVIRHSLMPFLDEAAKDFVVKLEVKNSQNIKDLPKDSTLNNGKNKIESKKEDSKKTHNQQVPKDKKEFKNNFNEETQRKAYNSMIANIPLQISLHSKVLCLYATAMFATKDIILESCAMLDKNQPDEKVAYIVSIIEAGKVFRSFTRNDCGFLQFMFPQFMNTRSQDLPQSFFDAGQFYLGFAKSFLAQIPLLGQKSIGITLQHAHDIDTMLDLQIAESLFKNIN